MSDKQTIVRGKGERRYSITANQQTGKPEHIDPEQEQQIKFINPTEAPQATAQPIQKRKKPEMIKGEIITGTRVLPPSESESEKEQEKTESKSEKTYAKKTKAEIQKEKQALKGEILKLSEKVEAITKENEEFKKQLDEAKQKISEITKEKEAIAKQLDETKNNLNDTMLKLENVTTERDATQSNLNEANVKLKEKTEEHAKTQEENTKLKEEGQKFEEEKKKMSEEIEGLEDIKRDREQIAELTRQMENEDDEDEQERKAEDTFPHEKVLQEGGLLKNIDTKYHKASYDPKQFHPELIVNDTRNQKIDIKQRVDLSSLKNYSLK